MKKDHGKAIVWGCPAKKLRKYESSHAICLLERVGNPPILLPYASWLDVSYRGRDKGLCGC